MQTSTMKQDEEKKKIKPLVMGEPLSVRVINSPAGYQRPGSDAPEEEKTDGIEEAKLVSPGFRFGGGPLRPQSVAINKEDRKSVV